MDAPIPEEAGRPLQGSKVHKPLNITKTVLERGKLSLSMTEAAIVRRAFVGERGIVTLDMPGLQGTIAGRVVEVQQRTRDIEKDIEVLAAPKFELALGEELRHNSRRDLKRALEGAKQRGDKMLLIVEAAEGVIRLLLPPAPEDDSILGMVDANAIASLSVTLQLEDMDNAEFGCVDDGHMAATSVPGAAAVAYPGTVRTDQPAGPDTGNDATGGRAGTSTSGPPASTGLPEPGMPAGDLTGGDRLKLVCAALHVDNNLLGLLAGNVRELRPEVLDACNARAHAQAVEDRAAHDAAQPRKSAELAQTVYWDMTGTPCLFWIDRTGENGTFNPVLLVLYVPGPVMRAQYAAATLAARNMQRRLMEDHTLNKIPRGPSKECGGNTLMAGYRSVPTNTKSRVTMYAHTSRSREARLVIGAFGLCIAWLLMAVWGYLVKCAAAEVAGTPAILAMEAPWGFVPVGLDYFTHPHQDPGDVTPTVVFLALWKSATGRRCVDFEDTAERAAHVSRNLFTFGGVSSFTRTQDCDLLVFDARLVVHGADLRVPLSAKADPTGAPCGVTVGSGVVSRKFDVAAGRAEARGRLELAADNRSASLHLVKTAGEQFEAEVRRMALSAGGTPGAGHHTSSQKRVAEAPVNQSQTRGSRARGAKRT